MGVGDLSFAAVSSLRSIDNWIAVINSNMAGSGKVGYKASRIKFGGGTISSLRPTQSPVLGITFAEQSLGTMQTTIDFSQGSVAASTDFTHLAIQRTSASAACFVLCTDFDPVATSQFFYTFDGEFHLDTNGYLVNADGLYVMTNNGSDGMNAVGRNPDNLDIVNDQIALDRLAINVFPNPQIDLGFSRFGSGVFEDTTVAPTAPPTNLATMDSIGNYSNADGNGRVIPFALEASNASLTQSVPELALAQKMYSAIAKVIQVALANIDTALQLGPR